MNDSQTSMTLLESLRDQHDRTAWQRFDTSYRPMLIRFAMSLGLDPHDAEEATQRTLAIFCNAYQRGKYDRTKGRFKNWLFTIARNEIFDLHNERGKHLPPRNNQGSSNDISLQIRDSDSLTRLWDKQWQVYILRLCLDRARTRFSSRDVGIFEQLALQQQSVERVAKNHNLSPDAVRQVRHRVLKFLRSVKNELGPDLEL